MKRFLLYEKSWKRLEKEVAALPPHELVIFGADGRELAHIVDLYDLSRAEADAVARKAVGRCLLMVGQRKCILDVKRTPKMVQLLSTSGEKSPAA